MKNCSLINNRFHRSLSVALYTFKIFDFVQYTHFLNDLILNSLHLDYIKFYSTFAIKKYKNKKFYLTSNQLTKIILLLKIHLQKSLIFQLSDKELDLIAYGDIPFYGELIKQRYFRKNLYFQRLLKNYKNYFYYKIPLSKLLKKKLDLNKNNNCSKNFYFYKIIPFSLINYLKILINEI